MRASSPTVKEVLKEASLTLQNQKEAAILLAHYLGRERLWLMTHDTERVENPEDYFALIQRRKDHEPIEYITGSVSFYGETFHIAPGALIPRPETELLIDRTKAIIEAEHICDIAEIGTGSGIISVMLARLFPYIHITATDINPRALQIARINAERFGVSDKIDFVHTSYLEGINRKFDMIISNPPYIAEGFALEQPLSYEPQDALFGGKEGDEMLREIITIAISRDVSFLACEMGYDQKAPLESFMKAKGIREYDFYQDYSGFDRGFTAKVKE
ncbi:MAG: peptide chain release factor N(5)-glutamine methyltransferase [Sulfurospirillum sp.]|nr:MAG: peptide chain release factor N(5)-glutamine methyltransferase [Sulfurospirillum sp.]